MRYHHGALAALLLLAAPAAAQSPLEGWSFTFSYENDKLGGTDRFYTSGLQLAARSPTHDPPGALGWLDAQLTALGWPGDVRWGFGIGHQIYTPRDTQRALPDPRDRPYAAFLYGALVLQRQERAALNTFELQLGVVGRSALGEQVQNGVHDAIRVLPANGWSSQIRDEPAANLIFERIQRVGLGGWGGVEADILPAVTLSLGNVATYAGAGATLRIGQGLETDFGPPRIRPALVGSAFFDPPADGGRFGWYVFAGGQGRLVGRDIFLDGNTFRDGPSVPRKDVVGDLSAGLVLHWRGLRFAYSQVWRSEEFVGQRAGGQTFGSVGLTARF